MQESLPRPTGYRILILPFTLPEVTKGGIHIAKATQLIKKDLATVVGYVVAMGPDAYGDDDISFQKELGVKKVIGLFSVRYAGARFQIEGGDMRLLNDDEILACIDDPRSNFIII